MRSNCNEKGCLHHDNMTKSERRGYLKLLKRVRSKEIVISETDKSGKLTISSYASYIQQGEAHIKNDRLSNCGEVEDSKKVVLSHTRVLSQILGPGKEHGESNETRLKSALHEDITTVADLTLCQKDKRIEIQRQGSTRQGLCVKPSPPSTRG